MSHLRSALAITPFIIITLIIVTALFKLSGPGSVIVFTGLLLAGMASALGVMLININKD